MSNASVSLRQKLADASGRAPSLEAAELEFLIAGGRTNPPTTHHSESLVLLTGLCEAVRRSTSTSNQQPDAATQALTRIFAPPVVSRLSDVEERSVIEGLSFLTSLFHVDREVASVILLRDGVFDCVADTIDLFSSPQFSLDLAHLLGQASGSKPCRQVMPTQVSQWLSAQLQQSTDSTLRAAAAVALIKIAKGRSSDDPDLGGQPGSNNWHDLAFLMKSIVIDGNQSALADAIEGLAYATVDASVKEDLSRDPIFLSRLFSLVPSRHRASAPVGTSNNLAILYGVTVIISNVCMYPPRVNDDTAQIETLKRFVETRRKPGQKGLDPERSPLDDHEHCRDRTRRLVTSGVVDVLSCVLYATESEGVRSTVGKALLDIVEDKANRGRVLQSGGAKALTVIIRRSLLSPAPASPVKPPVPGAEVLSAIQALAKLAITSSPVQVFGPSEGAMYDAVRPLTLLLLHSSSSLLQRFESMMALTNLSSQSPELASRIARTENLMDRVELFLLEDHVLVRRAAMELICNLVVGSDELFEKYSTSESKLQIVLALCDVDDLQTRRAASGSLATLTIAPTASRVLLDLQTKKSRVLTILTQLIDPSSLPPPEDPESSPEGSLGNNDPDLVHRGVISVRNFLVHIQDANERKQICDEAEKVGLSKALAKVIQDRSMTDAVTKPAADALKFFRS